jgi:hypothetical protein
VKSSLANPIRIPMARGCVAHYISGHQTVEGVVVATQRRIDVRNDDRSANYSRASITLDLFDIEVE